MTRVPVNTTDARVSGATIARRTAAMAARQIEVLNMMNGDRREPVRSRLAGGAGMCACRQV
jgi:hypothetical protein